MTEMLSCVELSRQNEVVLIGLIIGKTILKSYIHIHGGEIKNKKAVSNSSNELFISEENAVFLLKSFSISYFEREHQFA